MSGSDFWSRRKAAVRAEEEADARAVEDEARASKEAAFEEKSDDELLAELGLPDPDTLQEGDDVKPFLARAVPERLRRRALRRLWRTNPVLANLDGLVDYGEDFGAAGGLMEEVKTAYVVGKGVAAKLAEVLPDSGGEAAQASAEPEGEIAAVPVETAAVELDLDHYPVISEHDRTFSPSRAPRMRFKFEI